MTQRSKSATPTRRAELADKLVVFVTGVLLCFYGLVATYLVVVAGILLLHDVDGFPVGGPTELFGIRIDLYWPIYFPVLIVVAVGCLIAGAWRMRAASRSSLVPGRHDRG